MHYGTEDLLINFRPREVIIAQIAHGFDTVSKPQSQNPCNASYTPDRLGHAEIAERPRDEKTTPTWEGLMQALWQTRPLDATSRDAFDLFLQTPPFSDCRLTLGDRHWDLTF